MKWTFGPVDLIIGSRPCLDRKVGWDFVLRIPRVSLQLHVFGVPGCSFQAAVVLEDKDLWTENLLSIKIDLGG